MCLHQSMSLTRLLRQGVADEQLARLEQDRGRKRSGSPMDEVSRSRKRSRSASSDSVSTISTNKSRSISPRQARTHDHDEYMTSQQHLPQEISRSPSKRRKRKHSPNSMDSVSRSPPRDTSPERKSRRHRKLSPNDRGRPSYDRRGSHRSRTRSVSIDKSRVAKGRRSLDDSGSSQRDGRIEDKKTEDERPDQSRPMRNNTHERPQPRMERSLSPFSKRLALTQAMNMPR